MAVYTNPKHLFFSDRIAACSDEAQLHYPRFVLTCNTLGRSELISTTIRRAAYATLRKQPTNEELNSYIREYHRQHLLFVYVDPVTGSLWGQWLIPDQYLPKYQTAEDRRGPAPNPKELEQFRQEYYAEKKRKSMQGIDISELSQNVSKSSAPSQSGPFVGVGVIEVEEKKKSTPLSTVPVDGSRPALATEEKNKPTKPTMAELQEYRRMWHETRDKRLAGVLTLSPKRERKLRARIAGGLTLARFAALIKKVASTPYLCGEGPSKWMVSFDWIIESDDNVGKIFNSYASHKPGERQYITMAPDPYEDLRPAVFKRAMTIEESARDDPGPRRPSLLDQIQKEEEERRRKAEEERDEAPPKTATKSKDWSLFNCLDEWNAVCPASARLNIADFQGQRAVPLMESIGGQTFAQFAEVLEVLTKQNFYFAGRRLDQPNDLLFVIKNTQRILPGQSEPDAASGCPPGIGDGSAPPTTADSDRT